jgi:hypothetical protein
MCVGCRHRRSRVLGKGVRSITLPVVFGEPYEDTRERERAGPEKSMSRTAEAAVLSIEGHPRRWSDVRELPAASCTPYLLLRRAVLRRETSMTDLRVLVVALGASSSKAAIGGDHINCPEIGLAPRSPHHDGIRLVLDIVDAPKKHGLHADDPALLTPRRLHGGDNVHATRQPFEQHAGLELPHVAWERAGSGKRSDASEHIAAEPRSVCVANARDGSHLSISSSQSICRRANGSIMSCFKATFVPSCSESFVLSSLSAGAASGSGVQLSSQNILSPA